MEIFGRSLEFKMLFTKCRDLSKMFFKSLIFKDFGSLWLAYIKQTNPNQNKFITRDGYEIKLSNNPHDAITVMVIFCRLEYGIVSPGSTVIDVGANIGVFSIYAARSGAAIVYAFEPNKESFDLLVNNIRINKLEKTIIPFNLAVGAIDGEKISIPTSSSPYNKIVQGNIELEHYDLVESISLPTFIKKNNINNIDFLKMDCEGAEYGIIYSMTEENFKRIIKFRVEHHYPEEKQKLIQFFSQKGFKKTKDNGISIMWFDR